MWRNVKMKKDLTKVKARLIELGYVDNEWLDKYLEVIEANLETRRSRTSTQAHHAIPVNAYWTSNEPYNRIEALKLARKDPVNFVVNLLYKDHLIIHSYLTLCTNLDEVQIRYEAQECLRKQNSIIAAGTANGQRGKMHVHKIIEDKVITRVALPKEIPLLLEKGWSLGRTVDSTRCYVNKNGEYKNICIKNLDKYLQDGWQWGAIGKLRYKTEKVQN